MALAVEEVLVDEQPLHAHWASRVDAVGRDAHLVRVRVRVRVRLTLTLTLTLTKLVETPTSAPKP